MRQSEGSLFLDHEDGASYQQLLKQALEDFSDNDDLSEKSLDKALKDAIFAVVDIPGNRDPSPNVRIDKALIELEEFLNAPSQVYECWIEVFGLDSAALPATFGSTRFTLLGEPSLDQLRGLVESKHQVQQAEKIAMINDRLAGEVVGRTAAIQIVTARDQTAALGIAEREVRATLECLNFFANLIPYNFSTVRIASGGSDKGVALRVTVAESGSFNHGGRVSAPWTYSIAKLRDLDRTLGEAVRTGRQYPDGWYPRFH